MEPVNILPHSQQPATSPYPEPDQSIPWSHFISRRYILILSSHLCPVLRSGLFQCSPANPFSLFPICSLEQCLMFLTTQFHPVFLRLSASYSQTLSANVSPSVKETKFHTNKNYRHNYSSLYFNLDILGHGTGEQKILNQMLIGTPCFQSALYFFLNAFSIC